MSLYLESYQSSSLVMYTNTCTTQLFSEMILDFHRFSWFFTLLRPFLFPALFTMPQSSVVCPIADEVPMKFKYSRITIQYSRSQYKAINTKSIQQHKMQCPTNARAIYESSSQMTIQFQSILATITLSQTTKMGP